MNAIEQSICQAVDVIVQKAIEQASYDKTIQATVISCVDATIGKYKVRYQDSTFYAYSGSSDITYTDGSNVYVLIPGNDMDKDKTILGTTKKLGINYVATAEGDEAYEPIGNNCINSTNTFELCSYRKDKYVQVLYSKDYGNNQNLISLDKKSVNEYIKNSTSLICGARIRTSLPVEQQYRGNYGIIFALDFIDNTNNNTVTRYYTVDVDKMIGNPYKLVYETRQYGIFDIDGANFKEVNSISIFTYDFPNSKNDALLVNDIFIRDIEFYGAARLSNEDLDSCSLSLITPQGTFFDDTSLSTDIRTIQAQVRVKGKVIDNNSQSLPFYWFVENVGITSQSDYYNKYGGQGWKCLNSFNTIKPREGDNPPVVEYVPGSYEWTVKRNDAIAKETKYKCAVVYDGSVITKEIVIKNLASSYDITITSDGGTKFYYDIGFPTLTCLVGGRENSSYIYSWAVTDNAGNFQTLSETTDLNNSYQNVYNNYTTLKNEIDTEAKPYAPNKAQLDSLKNQLDSYNTITRVQGNKIHHLSVNTITNFSIYKCSVHYGDTYLGTASIILTNSLDAEGAYSIVINNGAQTYKYNENGISPASGSLDNPIDIPALSFTIYDNLGQPIDDEVVKHCSIKWIVPSADTLLEIPNTYTASEVNLINETETYSDLMSFSYQIADRYAIEKTRNNIQLIVDYKGMNLATSTDFTFAKEGEPGTNGTEFLCKIVPNIAGGSTPPLYPTITQNSSGGYSLNYTTRQSGVWFNAQLWHNGEKIFDSNATGNTTEGKTATVVWSILRNKYTASVSDDTCINITDAANGRFSFSGYELTRCPANIVKVAITYDKVVYYATMPIITVKLTNNNYKVNLKEYTGFRYATYTSDGRSPKYDNSNPFELIVTQNINGYQEDVSTKTSSTYSLTYSWRYKGEIYENSRWINSIHLGNAIISNLTKNQKAVKPLDDYDGQCVNNALECIISKGSAEIARIHIPIHLLLNKYGISAINGWDGNSVNVDTEGGFILAPQVGAGIKEKDNSFTGVVIGKVKESNQSTADVGLIGYAKGQRSIFLDAYTGKSTFGVNGKGQIIIDPTNNKAQLYSGNYKEATSSSAGAGLLIDLTTPEIKFGSGNFSVDKNGYLTAKGGGSIAGWNIDDDSLFTGTKSSASNVRISSADFTRSINGVSRSALRLALGSKFAVSSDGTMYAGDAIIGTGTNKITIGKSSGSNSYSAIYSGNKKSFDANSSGFYIGTDGIALGSHNGSNSAFQVTNAGQMTARSGYIGNGSSGWTIGSNYLKNGSKNSYNDSNSGVFLGTSGIGLGRYFNVSSSGSMYAKRGTIANWEITDNSIRTGGGTWGNNAGMYFGSSGIRLGSNFSVTSGGNLTCVNGNFSGKITASSGTIGGWTINGSGLTNGTMYIYSNGSIGGSKWSISSSGYASFSNLHATGGTISMGGSTISGGSGGSTTLGSGSTYVGNQTLRNWTVGVINATTINTHQLNTDTFNGMNCSWTSIRYISRRTMTWRWWKDVDIVTDVNFDDKTYSYLNNIDIIYSISSTSYYRRAYMLRGTDSDDGSESS